MVLCQLFATKCSAVNRPVQYSSEGAEEREKAGRQASTRKAFSRSHALEGLVLLYLHELADKKLSRHSESRISCSTFSVLCGSAADREE